tara:strand:- start:8 stop:613 length:606 start_codon:yes stop_codon:yes gene_type:complete
MTIQVCNDRSLASITSLPSGVSGSSLVLLSTQTASSSATIDFTSNIDSTYKEYVFKFFNIHAATDGAEFQFNLSADSGSNYNVTKTTTMFYAYQTESGSSTGLSYDTNLDLAQSTSDQIIMENLGNNNDENGSGVLHLFDPSSTTFIKHFMSRGMRNGSADYSVDYSMAGYGNTTSAIDAIRFKMSSGNIDAGTIKMYGVV